jgi:hypothetical protein
VPKIGGGSREFDCDANTRTLTGPYPDYTTLLIQQGDAVGQQEFLTERRRGRHDQQRAALADDRRIGILVEGRLARRMAIDEYGNIGV